VKINALISSNLKSNSSIFVWCFKDLKNFIFSFTLSFSFSCTSISFFSSLVKFNLNLLSLIKSEIYCEFNDCFKDLLLSLSFSDSLISSDITFENEANFLFNPRSDLVSFLWENVYFLLMIELLSRIDSSFFEFIFYCFWSLSYSSSNFSSILSYSSCLSFSKMSYNFRISSSLSFLMCLSWNTNFSNLSILCWFIPIYFRFSYIASLSSYDFLIIGFNNYWTILLDFASRSSQFIWLDMISIKKNIIINVDLPCWIGYFN